MIRAFPPSSRLNGGFVSWTLGLGNRHRHRSRMPTSGAAATLKPKKAAPTWSVHLALFFTQVAYGGYQVLAKQALQGGADKVVFCVHRDVIALIILAPTAYFLERGKRPPITKSLLMGFFLLGCTGILGNQLLMLIGLNYTGPIITTAFQPSVPVFTFILAIAFGMETVRLDRKDGLAKTGGVILCVVGALVMTTFRGPPVVGSGMDVLAKTLTVDVRDGGRVLTAIAQEQSGVAEVAVRRGVVSKLVAAAGFDMWHVGVLCLLGNCLSMASYFTLQAPILARYPASTSVTAMAYLFGAALVVTVGLLTVEKRSSWFLTPSQLGAAFYGGSVASALNYALQAWGNKRLGPSMVALYMPLQPLAGAIFSRLVLGSTIFLGSVLGGILILGGLYLVTWGRGEAIRLQNSSSTLGGIKEAPLRILKATAA
eukprot:TRINITY_DN22801_c0_g1_i1.p1 TRINITY_DN22801_c0_g1~~TRINITY_DN22801_c0_g1_i1.p1  ORF type:complete len:427 (-),score=87.94 TRINITY_DN22801_c0_g1_i1:476-1756(-)